MDLSQLIEAYGYWIVLGGTLLEGESVLLLAGFAAFQGYLELHNVIAVAILGGFLGDQAFFFAGRHYGEAVLARFPKHRAAADRAKALLLKYDLPIILGIRFMYGLRIVLPFVIGTTKIPALRFQALNLVGAAIWASSGASLGYLFGDAIEYMLGDIQRYEKYLLAALALAGIAYWLISRRRASRVRKS